MDLFDRLNPESDLMKAIAINRISADLIAPYYRLTKGDLINVLAEYKSDLDTIDKVDWDEPKFNLLQFNFIVAMLGVAPGMLE